MFIIFIHKIITLMANFLMYFENSVYNLKNILFKQIKFEKLKHYFIHFAFNRENSNDAVHHLNSLRKTHIVIIKLCIKYEIVDAKI